MKRRTAFFSHAPLPGFAGVLLLIPALPAAPPDLLEGVVPQVALVSNGEELAWTDRIEFTVRHVRPSPQGKVSDSPSDRAR